MDGLQDTSRSGMDMSMTALLKRAGFSFADTKALLGCWPHGAGAEHLGDERYFRRMWGRNGPLPDAEDGGAAETQKGWSTSTVEWQRAIRRKAALAANRVRCRDRRQSGG